MTVTLRLSVHVRGLDKWTIVPTSRSDHRVTASHRINPLLVWALCTRSEALPETFWTMPLCIRSTPVAGSHRRGAGGLVEGKEGLGEGLGGWLCRVQVYLAERQGWDMQSASSPAEACRVLGRSQPSTCQSPPALSSRSCMMIVLEVRRGHKEEEG